MSFNQSSYADSETNEARREILEAYAKGADEAVLNKKDIRLCDADRYGFVCKISAPALTKDEIEKECVLQAKWLKVLNKWDRVFPSVKIRKLIFRGLPNSLRGEVWKRILETPKLIKANENKYETVRYQGLKISNDIKQIDLDINRTYRDHVMFMHRYGLKQKSLFNVLTAYTIHNSEVGYCQGMSSVAALVLMYMDEEDSFWALSTLLTGQKHTMHGFFINGFPKLMRFQAHHAKILRKMLPSLADHFDQQGILSSLYTLKWYMQCFLDRLPFYLILRLWDVFILEGDKILHPIGYTLLKIHKKTLIKMGMDDLAQFLTSSMQEIKYNADQFMDSLLSNIDELKKNNLYPAPSVVKGELPPDNNSRANDEVLSNSFRNNGVHAISVDDDSMSHASYVESEIIDELTANRFVSGTTNVRYRGLPAGIPLPPTNSAPVPTVLTFIYEKGRISLISERASTIIKPSMASIIDSQQDPRTETYHFQQNKDPNTENPGTTDMASERMENIKVVQHNLDSTEFDCSVDDT